VPGARRGLIRGTGPRWPSPAPIGPIDIACRRPVETPSFGD
jgi:hypothetical protein